MEEGRVVLRVEHSPVRIQYSLSVDGRRRLYGEVQKLPGWGRVWEETSKILHEVKGELEEGTGLRSRAFQQTSGVLVGI